MVLQHPEYLRIAQQRSSRKLSWSPGLQLQPAQPPAQRCRGLALDALPVRAENALWSRWLWSSLLELVRKPHIALQAEKDELEVRW